MIQNISNPRSASMESIRFDLTSGNAASKLAELEVINNEAAS